MGPSFPTCRTWRVQALVAQAITIAFFLGIFCNRSCFSALYAGGTDAGITGPDGTHSHRIWLTFVGPRLSARRTWRIEARVAHAITIVSLSSFFSFRNFSSAAGLRIQVLKFSSFEDFEYYYVVFEFSSFEFSNFRISNFKFNLRGRLSPQASWIRPRPALSRPARAVIDPFPT